MCHDDLFFFDLALGASPRVAILVLVSAPFRHRLNLAGQGPGAVGALNFGFGRLKCPFRWTEPIARLGCPFVDQILVSHLLEAFGLVLQFLGAGAEHDCISCE